MLFIVFSVGILYKLFQLAALLLRQDSAARGKLAFLKSHDDHAAHTRREKHLRRRDHDSPGKLRKGLDHPGSHGCLQHSAEVVKRQRLVRDKDGQRIQKLIDRCPHLTVTVNTQIVALLSEYILLSEEPIINAGIGNELKEQRGSLFSRAALL